MEALKKFLTLALVFLVPLFFLPLTQEYFVTHKLYLLAGVVVLLLVVSTLQLLVSKKIVWKRSPFDLGLSFLFVTTILSIIVVTPNKVEAILNPYFGLMMLFALTIFSFFLSQEANKRNAEQYFNLLEIAGFVVALVTIVFFFNPFKNVALPTQFQFLKFSTFSPIGNQLDLTVFLGFLLVVQLGSLLGKRRSGSPAVFGTLVIVAVAAIMSVYNILKPENVQQSILLTPFSQSWYAAIETLKNPLSVLFGAGVGNFSAVFTRVKDVVYNQSPLWQISSFNTSRSAILHIFTETGLLGLSAFGFLLYSLWVELKRMIKDNPARKMVYLGSAYVALVLLLLPPSFISFFLLILVLYLVASENSVHHEGAKQEIDLTNLVPVYLGGAIILIVFIAVGGYFLGRTYLAEVSFKKSLDGYLTNNAKTVYDNQRVSIQLNPYIERFHTNFAQTNLLIANNIASKGGDKLSDQDRQTVVQAIQTAIAEAKAAVALNPQKSANWENLAAVYRNILNAVQGADTWTVSSYQRAIQLDPLNPIYRLNLGGVYYSLQAYNDAINLFEQSISLKSDWANAHYNLAWAAYQAKDYQRAATEMQTVLRLVDQKQAPDDYAKAQKELKQFKSQIPTSEATPSGELQLPNPEQQPQISPKLELPEGASPEAQ